MAALTLSYFAWVREAMGCTVEQVDPPANVATIADLIDWLASRDAIGAGAFADRSRIRAARDGVMALPGTALAGASEISLFPPVTGG
jgi:molybdopterin synthase sulfur carrier subunit